MKAMPLADRFWPKVEKGDGCWIWKASFLRSGYGAFGWKQNGKLTMKNAHRVAWFLANGPIPEGMSVLHRCDNRKCVRPDHLFLGNQRDNLMDMILKGRCGVTKLTKEQVIEIKKEQANGWRRGQDGQIAKRFGVKRKAVYDIRHGIRWTHINCPIPANAGVAVPSGDNHTGI